MRYLTIEDIKRQANIDLDYDGDDVYLEQAGNTAEDMVEQLVNKDLAEIEGAYGELPSTLKQAMLIAADYYYAVERGSSTNDGEMPEIFYTMIKLFRSFT